jgi:twitching motility protein PilT
MMLATSLQAVVTQQLLPGLDGGVRAPAVEVLIATPAVRNLIREKKGYQLANQMQAGARFGMITMDQSIAALVQSHRVSVEVGLDHASNPDDLRSLLGITRSS